MECMIKTKKDLTKDFLQDFATNGKCILRAVIDDFAQEGKVFSNESQLQFELGFELQKLFWEWKLDYCVKFEVVSYNEEAKEKMRTDLVVEMPSKSECVAIELKFKTARTDTVKAFQYIVNNRKTVVAAHGAYDNGCYDFWLDVSRLEKLVSGDTKYNLTDMRVVNSYAIIMSNDINYRIEHQNSMFKNFFIIDNSEVIGTRKWWYNGEDSDKICGKTDWRYQQSIEIKNTYDITWHSYELPESARCNTGELGNFNEINVYEKYKFHYLIMEKK